MFQISTGIFFLVSAAFGLPDGTTAMTTMSTSSLEDGITFDQSVRWWKESSGLFSNPVSLSEYVREYFKDTPLLAEIARCESGIAQFDIKGNVISGNKNSLDVGVMQINEKYHLKTSEKLGLDIHTLDGNLAYAKWLYDNLGTDPWYFSKKCWKMFDAEKVAMYY
jgi:hypothetical protein